jgi:adenylate cyclase
MRCPSCGFDDPEGLTFCGECGTPLTAPCPTCGFANLPRFTFCGNCGGSLAPLSRMASPPTLLASQPQRLAATRPVMRKNRIFPCLHPINCPTNIGSTEHMRANMHWTRAP